MAGQQQSTAGADVGVMITANSTAAERGRTEKATGSLILYQIIPSIIRECTLITLCIEQLCLENMYTVKPFSSTSN